MDTVAIISAVLGLLQEVAPLVTNSGTVGKIIKTLTDLAPVVMGMAKDLAPIIKNIITSLRSSDAVTDDQMVALDALEVQIDADFEAAASAAQGDL